MLHVIIYIFLQ